MPKQSRYLKQLFEQVKKEQQGRLDILVNNAFCIPDGGPNKLFGKFWELLANASWKIFGDLGKFKF